MKIKIIFKWYDLWVGFFIDKGKRTIYFFPIPMVGLVFTMKGNYCTECKKPISSNDMSNYYICRECDKSIRNGDSVLLRSELIKRSTITSEELHKSFDDIGYTSQGF